ncbi:MliC family protein [Chryseobacterium binzhouense]|uniref:MliC family protein n=1 Tax=Chryseobacterium binzhouense TaxID=2593646 RepID=UPI00289A319D|nr:MliC family protein [Chryseobacterium binzhouense]
MKKLSIIAISILLLSCKRNEQAKSLEISRNTDMISSGNIIPDDLIHDTLTTNKGYLVNIVFNNATNTVSIFYEGDHVELKGQQTASGVRYTGSGYELLGKGSCLELKKDNKTIAKKQ